MSEDDREDIEALVEEKIRERLRVLVRTMRDDKCHRKMRHSITRSLRKNLDDFRSY